MQFIFHPIVHRTTGIRQYIKSPCKLTVLENSAVIKVILSKYIQGTISSNEREILFAYLADSTNADECQQLIGDLSAELHIPTTYITSEWEPMIEGILETAKASNDEKLSSPVAPTTVHRIHFLKTAWLRYAAAVLVLLGVGGYLWVAQTNQRGSTGNVAISLNPLLEVVPGGNKAVLTLTDGRTILLDSAASGTLAEQGNTTVTKNANGQLTYHLQSAVKNNEQTVVQIGYNTISTPVGGQYQIVLPDGSKVWLNAASSIRFPTAFVDERNVSITGEAYFEIVADKSKPFIVSAKETEVNVLGTSFNINAYEEEPSIKTTLLEGSVKVSTNHQKSILLKPNQQSSYNPSNNKLSVVAVEGTDIVAWKDNIFNFHRVKLPEVMRQLKRWYNIEVKYPNGVPDIEFWGRIRRDMTLAQMILFLKKSEVQCHLENEKDLIIANKP